MLYTDSADSDFANWPGFARMAANAGDCVSADNDIAHTEPAAEVQPEEAAATADQQRASLYGEE